MRKALRILFYAFFWSITLFAIMWYEGYIPRYLAKQVKFYFDHHTDYEIQASDIHFSWPFTLHLKDLSIKSKTQHSSLHEFYLKSFEARISISSLFGKRLTLRSLSLHELQLKTGHNPTDSKTSLDLDSLWSALPVPLVIKSFHLYGWQVNDSALTPQVIHGSAQVQPNERQASLQLISEIAELYPNNPENWDLDLAKSRELSLKSTTNSLGCLAIHVRLLDDSIIAHDIRVDLPDFTLSGLIHVDAQGRLDGTQLEATYKHTRGTLSGAITLTDTFLNPKMQFVHSSGSLHGSFNLSERTCHLEGELGLQPNLFKLRADYIDDQLAFIVEADACSFGNSHFHDLSMEGTLDRLFTDTTHPLALRLQGYDEGRFFIESKGEIKVAPNFLGATVNYLRGEALAHKFSTVAPFEFTYSDHGITASPLDVQLEKGRLYFAFSQENEHTQVAVKVDDVPLPLFHPIFRSKNITGAVSGDALLLANSENVRGRFQLSLQSIAIASDNPTLSPTLDCLLEGNLDHGILRLAGGLGSRRVDQVSFKGQIPLYEFNENTTPLDFKLSGSGEISPFIELLPMPSINLVGQTAFDIGLQGTLANPILTGEITLEKGVFENIEVGAYFKDISAKLVPDPLKQGHRWLLKDFIANDGRRGKLSGSGWCDIDFGNKLPFELNLFLENALLVQLPDVQGWFNADLVLAGNTEGGALTGKMQAQHLQFELEEDPAPEVGAIEIIYLNQPQDKKLPVYTLDTTEDLWPISLDLEVSMPHSIGVEGKGLSSKWKGRVHITGTSRYPLLNGEIKIAQGQFVFRGKKIQITQATVTFAGEPAKKTSIYLIASLDLSDVQIEAVLRGPLKNPNVTFRSSPPMSQHEILSWLLFNRGTSEISSLQNTQISHSLKSLQKQADSSPDVITKLQNAIGIDRIDFNHDERGDSNAVSMQVGKYISNGILISLNKSITAESNQIALEANLFRDFKIHAEVSDDSDDQLLLLWKKSY